MSLTAFFVRNCSGSSLRLKSISPSFKDLQLKTDEQYLFKSPEEYNAYRISVQAWIQIKKLEITPIEGAAAKREIEKRIEVPADMQNYNDFDDDLQDVIEIRTPTEEKKSEESQSQETQTDTETETESEESETETQGSEGDAEALKEAGTPTDDQPSDEQKAQDAKAELEQEKADLEGLLKDTVDVEAKKKINARLKEIKKLLK